MRMKNAVSNSEYAQGKAVADTDEDMEDGKFRV
jgi:hypothetical protein